MRIPKEIAIGGLKFKILFDNELTDNKEVFGEINHHTHIILLTNQTKKGGKLTDEFIEQTLLHELTHAILEIMQERELNDNEKFINTFSTFLHQVITQLK